MTKGTKRSKKKETRRNAESDRRYSEVEATKETTNVTRESNYISYLKKDELHEIKALLNTDVLDDCNLLIGAVAIGNFSVVKKLLKLGCHINCRGKNGWSSLMWAVKCKRLEMVDLLIKRGADITASNIEGDNAMLLAIQSDDWHQDAFLDLWNTISRFSCSFNEVVNHANKKGYSLLHFSVKRQWENIVDRLIEDGADVNCINHRGITPLMIAGYSGDVMLIRRLLRSKANVLLEDKRGCTALCYAIAFMFPKHVELSSMLTDKLMDEFSIFKPMMLSEEIYLKRRLDLLVYPPDQDFTHTIKKVIVPLTTFFVRFNKDGLLMLLELQVFGRIQEAIERHIEDVEYIKALMAVTLELVRDCQCCINELLPVEVGKCFVIAGIPESCLRILKKHDQTSMKKSIISAAMLPLISVCTSRGLSGKMWLQSNFKHFIPFYQSYNVKYDWPFKISTDDFHTNLLRKSVKDFEKLVKNIESGQKVVENLDNFKSDENLLETGSDVSGSTISNPRSVDPSFIDFLSERCCPEMVENGATNVDEPSVSLKHVESNQSPQHDEIKLITTDGYTNLTELFMSRKNTENKNLSILRRPGINSCLDESRAESLEPDDRATNGVKMVSMTEKIDNDFNAKISNRTLLKSRIEDGKTFSSVLQQNIKTDTGTYFKSVTSYFSQNTNLIMENTPETGVETYDRIETSVNNSGSNSSKSFDVQKSFSIDSFSEETEVKDVEGRYKNPISNFLWSLDVDDGNPITGRPNVIESKETKCPLFEDSYNINCSIVGDFDDDESENRAKAEAEVEDFVERSPIILEKRQQFEPHHPNLKGNYDINYCSDDGVANITNAENSMTSHCERNSKIISTSFDLLKSIYKDDTYDISCVNNDDDDDRCKIIDNYDQDDNQIDDVSNTVEICKIVNDVFPNNHNQKYEAQKLECNSYSSTSRNDFDGGLCTLKNDNFNENHTENKYKTYYIDYNENLKPEINEEQKCSTLTNGKCIGEIEEYGFNQLDSQIEKLDKQLKHIINQYEMLCKIDFENGYPNFKGDEGKLLELMTSLPIVEISHLQNLKQRWNDLREKLKNENTHNLNGVVKKIEEYLQNFSESLDKKIDACRIHNEPELPDIGEDLKYSSLNHAENDGVNEYECSNDHDWVIIDNCSNNYRNLNSDYDWYSVGNNEEHNFKSYTFGNLRFLETGPFEKLRATLKGGDTYGREDFVEIQPGYMSTSDSNRKAIQRDYPDHESLLIEDRKSMYCSQNYLDLIISLMNLNEKKREVLGHGTLVMASASTYPEYKLRDGGNFGAVELGMDQEGYPLAVKKLSRCKTKTTEMITSTLKTLLHDMRSLHHHHIVPYVNYIETEFSVMIAQPLCERNLDEHITELKTCNELGNHSLDLVHQMMKGLQYLHSRTAPIIHGNLKPTNILIDSKDVVRLADFGLHKVLFKQKSPLSDGMIWWAKETYVTHKNSLKMVCTLQSDIQVAGMLMHYILTGGRHPFERPNSLLIVDPYELTPVLYTTNCEANDLLTWMLETFNNRPSINQVMSHIFFWSEERKWEYFLACSGIDSNYNESQLPLGEFSKFIKHRALEVKTGGNWATIIQQNFPEHYITASRCCDPESLSGLLVFINLSILNTESEFRNKFRKIISLAFPNLPLFLFRFVEGSEWETHPDLIKYSYHSLC